MKKTIKIILYLALILITLIFSINFYVSIFSKNKIFSDINFLQQQKTGLVLGASVKGRKGPSDILKDRLLIALKAYKEGKVLKIIVSGDNSKENYNEPIVMKDFLVKNGVKEYDIYMDFAGFDTYDSIYRAKYIFGVNKLVIFTQKYHLKRAIYIATRLGIDSIGISTDLHQYILLYYYDFREILARFKAFLDIEILNSKPKFLGEKIVIN